MKFAKFGPLMLALGLGSATLFTQPAHAALLAIPADLIGAEQPAADTSPLGVDGVAYRFQFAYGASLLTGLSIGDTITGLTFRIDAFPEGAYNTDLPPQTVANYEIGIGQSQNAPGSLSLTFADNRGADFVTARTGPLSFNTGDFTGGGSPNAFGTIIGFTTPYVYIGGPLLIEIAHDASFTEGRFVDDSDLGYPDAEQVFGVGYDAAFADFGSELQAMIIQLQFTPGANGQQLPEPNGLNLFGAALASLMGVTFATRRQRRQPA